MIRSYLTKLTKTVCRATHGQNYGDFHCVWGDRSFEQKKKPPKNVRSNLRKLVLSLALIKKVIDENIQSHLQ